MPPLEFASKAQVAKSTDIASHADTPEMILLLQEQCRQEWSSISDEVGGRILENLLAFSCNTRRNG
jgi:hypothetical protein